jgi:phosphopantothenoylcysteine decarboxylase/phosphopantothenate--cysteine ligase
MEPDHGRLTGSDVGVGRFPETVRILKEFKAITDPVRDLAGKKVLVTAGGTREALDPIRYIGNRSSGKQGYAIACAAAKRGAIVTLISANNQATQISGLSVINVESAQEMFDQVDKNFDGCDILVMSAAVADAKPSQVSADKIKKGALLSIDLTANPDIIATVSSRKKNQVVIAFAAETSLDLAEGERKLLAKGADILFLNDVAGSEIFGSGHTQGVILVRSSQDVITHHEIERISKDTLADLLLDQALHKLG